jgi:uncharacterized protein YjbJ (UPF0337 family)
MNRDILAAEWKQLRGEIRIKWGKLTDNDLDMVQGRWEKLVGLLQERYAHTRQGRGRARRALEKVTEKVARRSALRPSFYANRPATVRLGA